jgi:hypothetical protein
MAWLYLEENCVFSLEKCYWTLLIQAAGWLLAALYVDNVRPDKHGVKLPLWYPFMPSYWVEAFKAAAAGWAHLTSAPPPAGVTKTVELHSTVGKAYKTPFAVSEINRKVAKSFMDRDDRGLVIRCSSSSTGGTADHSSRANAAAASAISLDNRVQRCSASSGQLRRREVRSTFSDAGEAAMAEASGDTQARGTSSASRVTFQHPVMHLSDDSSIDPTATAYIRDDLLIAGNSISLEQFQQQQQQQQQLKQGALATAGRLWWQKLRRQPAKHDDEAAATAAPPNKKRWKPVEIMRGQKEIPGALGLVPVVLDPGVLQEERRMKEIWYSGERPASKAVFRSSTADEVDFIDCEPLPVCLSMNIWMALQYMTSVTDAVSAAPTDVPWTAKQDIVQVFGLRKVYRMPAERQRCLWLGSPAQYRQQSVAGNQPKQHCKQQQRQQFIAVADSWFGVAKGQLLCLLGPNGAGKTTTINCMTGDMLLSAE